MLSGLSVCDYCNLVLKLFKSLLNLHMTNVFRVYALYPNVINSDGRPFSPISGTTRWTVPVSIHFIKAKYNAFGEAVPRSLFCPPRKYSPIRNVKKPQIVTNQPILINKVCGRIIRKDRPRYSLPRPPRPRPAGPTRDYIVSPSQSSSVKTKDHPARSSRATQRTA